MLDLKELQYTENDVESFKIKMHVNGVLSVLSTVLAVYLIIYKSPVSMGPYKWFLLNIVVCIFWFEVFIILIFMPFPIFPNPGFCALGPLRTFDWYWGATVPFFILTLFLGVCGMAVILAAGFRLSAIYGSSQKLTRPLYSGLLLLSQVLYAIPTLVAGLMSVQDRAESVEEMLENYPKMEEFFNGHTCFVIPLDNNPKLYICLGIALVQLVTVQIISILIIYMSFRSLIKRKSLMSNKVYNIHMQFVKSISIQFAVPTITINFPFLFYCIFLITQSELGVGFSQYLFMGVTTHSFFNTLIMVTMTTPYRDTELQYTENDVESFKIKMHVNGVLSVLSTVLAVYLIIYKSPVSMGPYKWFLLNIVVCIFWFEVFIILIFMPFPIFPNPGFCALGPLRTFDWYWGATVPFFMLTEFLGICGMSVNLAAGFRLSAIYGVSQKLTRPLYSGLLLLSQVLYAIPTLVAGLMSVQDRAESVEEMLENYPKMEEFFNGHTCFVIPLDNNPKLYICLGIALAQLVTVEIMSAVIIYMSFRSLIKRKSIMSNKVYSMHMQFIWSISAQFAVPIITINTPFLLYCIFLITQSELGVGFSQYLFMGVTTHSFFNTLIMVMMTTPYRDTVKGWLRIKNNSTIIIPSAISVTLGNLEQRTTVLNA